MDNNLKALRLAKQMTQAELAVKSGVSRVAISQIESGNTSYIKSTNAIRLANALGCAVEDIIFFVPHGK